MKNYRILSVIVLLVSAMISCDVIDDPIPENQGQILGGSLISDSLRNDSAFNAVVDTNTLYVSDPSLNINDFIDLFNFINKNDWLEKNAPNNDNQRFVILEEFTGHYCTFCPDGTREIVRLDNKYLDTLIPLGIHAGTFAKPRSLNGKYSTDFRVPNGDGEAYQNIFNVSGYPSGIVSRINANASGLATWEQDIVNNKNKTVLASLQVTNNTDSTINAIRTKVEIEWKSNLSEAYNLQLFLLEDNIIDWQLDNGVEDSTYNHRHVLRKVVNSRFGNDLDPAVAGNKVVYEYIYEYNAAWKFKDLEVVAFIFERDQNSLDVIQANASKLK